MHKREPESREKDSKEKMENGASVVEAVCVRGGYDCIFPLDKEQCVFIKGRGLDNLFFKDLLTPWKVERYLK